MDEIRRITGGVTATEGFKAASTAARAKCRDRKGIALIYSEAFCKPVGTFTSNIVKAAPVKWDKSQVTGNVPARIVVTSAGIANACTGEEGMGYCSQTADTAAAVPSTPAESVLVASAGVVGKQLPMDKIRTGTEAMAPLLDGGTGSGTETSKTIMTTDTENKETAVQSELGGVTVTIDGICKGLGMIHPSICTMLNFVTTDAAINKEVPQETLSEDIKDTYNIISVDDDTSTNDATLFLANGLAKDEEMREKNSDYQVFYRMLNYIGEALAKEMAEDDGGCTALLEVTIVDAKTKNQVKVLAKSVITSNLTRIAIFGRDANWGRIPCTMGCSGASFDPEKVNLFFKNAAGKIQIIKDGVTVDYSGEQVTKILSQPQVTAVADIKMGDAQTTA